MSWRRRALATALALATVALVATGCSLFSSASSTPKTDPKPGLVLVGDSITHRSSDVLEEVLGDRYDVTIVAEDGRTIAEQQESAREAASTNPKYVFINLGTNDAVKGVSIADAEAGLVDMAALFPDACLIFSTINTNTTIPVYNAKAATLNEWIKANAPHVVDWNAAVLKGYRRNEPIVADGLHPNDEGKQQYAALIDDALADCPD